MQIKNEYVSLDSQCYSYLLDAISGISEPTDLLASEKIALIRAWFYKPGRFSFTITETVVNETSKIKNIERRNLHDSFRNTLFHDPAVQHPDAVKNRANEFYKYHPKLNDCLVLAEAEELGLGVLLTYDHRFWKRLQNVSNLTTLVKPSDYWISLQLPKGVRPTSVPHVANPLSQQQWWRW